MARRKPTQQRLGLPCLLFLANSASASFLTLSSFELLDSVEVTLSCFWSYNLPIPGCTVNDFIDGQTCSATCETGLRKVSGAIQSTCHGARAQPETLFAHALDGSLVNALCSDRISPPTTTTLVTVRPTHRPPPPPSSSSSTQEAPPSSYGLSQVTSVPRSSSVTSSSQSMSSPEPTITDISKPIAPATSQATSEAEAASSSDSSPPKETSGSHDSSGGGSPFDVGSQGIASPSYHVGWPAMCVIAATLGLVLR